MLIAIMSAFLVGAVVYDVVSHRLPNYYLLLGLLVAVSWHSWGGGWDGFVLVCTGVLTGFVLFIPMYVWGGMAAGDVKLMAVVGSFLGMTGALWAGAYSLMVGSLLGVVYLLYKGQLARLFGRYWAMASLRVNIPAENDDAARHRFPYALAVAVGTLFSLYWTPI